ncbi:MAG: hypothetical protein M3238_03210 [Actinomycetota bacterium]|nr:hypothetical protein [Actinomycetota bacterium]
MADIKKGSSSALGVLIAVIGLLVLATIPVYAGPGGGGNGQPSARQSTNPDPEPSPSRSAERGGDCYDNPNKGGGGGSNQSGDYDSTCDQGAGDHGQGGSSGKCAGCTGKSDYKNPPGQYKGDGNNGYECDHNKGVGKGNPPHSQCRPETVSTPPPPPPPPPPPGCPPNSNNPRCVPPPPINPPIVSPTIITVCDADATMPGVQVCGEIVQKRTETRAGRILPLTGATGLAVFLYAALALIGAGASLLGARFKK